MSYVATIGFFDGVHRGHRYLIGQLLATAARRGEKAAIITFAQHPKDAALLTPYKERIQRLKETGVDEIFCFQFPVIRQMTAEEFLHVLHDQCEISTLLCGYDHRFGCDHRTAEDMVSIGSRIGVDIQSNDCSPEGDMSSSKIRRALLEGDLDTANRMLGYTYTLTGEVVHGKAVGRTIGFPTANLRLPEGKLVPKSGVYATEGGIVNINHEGLVEVHYIDVQRTDVPCTKDVQREISTRDLYGQTITVPLLRRIRDERQFGSLEELKEQIERDVREWRMENEKWKMEN